MFQDFKEKIARMQTTIEIECKTLESWQDYKESGHLKHRKQIELLEQEMLDMQNNYNEITRKILILAVKNYYVKTCFTIFCCYLMVCACGI